MTFITTFTTTLLTTLTTLITTNFCYSLWDVFSSPDCLGASWLEEGTEGNTALKVGMAKVFGTETCV